MFVLCEPATDLHLLHLFLAKSHSILIPEHLGLDTEICFISVDDVLIEWAYEVVCMEKKHAQEIDKFPKSWDKKVIVLDIPDNFVHSDQF